MPNVRPLGLVLAGGLARRMGGGDKALIQIGGRPILDRVLSALNAQCSRIVINANGDPSRFSFSGLPIIPDDIPNFAGPLAGILAGMDWAAEHSPDTRYLVSVPGDCPFLPHDLVDRLEKARKEQGKVIACAKSGDWRYPVVGLWPVNLRHDLRRAVTVENLRKVEIWMTRHGVADAEWPNKPVDPFFNVNNPEDAARANEIAAQYPDA
jgi:molybdopterin-guanine dinucleotide biosynthesis protein A